MAVSNYCLTFASNFSQMRKLVVILIVYTLGLLQTFAQQTDTLATEPEWVVIQRDTIYYEPTPDSLSATASTQPKQMKEMISALAFRFRHLFDHLDVGLNLGTTGLGLDAALPISESFQLRAGFSFIPKFDYNMSFGVEVGDDPATSDSKFERLSGMLESFTGYKVDNTINMVGQPTSWNFSLIADFKPFKNKQWHLSAGFYVGPSQIAKAFNTTEDMPSLMAVGIYNNLYDRLTRDDPETGLPWFVEHSAVEEMMGVALDPGMLFELRERVQKYGRMGIHVGNFKETGAAYNMEPDANSMVKAKMKVNSFKPYLGFGYSGRLLKNSDKYRIGFDCGAWFWGGTPSITTHDGTDLANDVENIGGKVGSYVDFFSAFKVYPVLSVRISRSIF